jgi:beta-glucosidase
MGNAAQDSTYPEKLARHGVKVTTILEGIQQAVSAETKVLYAKGCDYCGEDTSGIDEAMAVAQKADAVVLVLGDRSGLTPDCTTGETRDSADLRLPGMQEALAQAILDTGKPVAVVLVTGRPYAIPALADRANALLEAWLPGEEGGAAVADVLFGEENPGGKLPATFPRSVGQVPCFYNSKPAGTHSHWYVDYVSEKVTPLFPFGHGLSYTTFAYSDLRVSPTAVRAGEVVEISVRVANTGKVSGDEVVQLYIQDEYASRTRPVKELKGFQRLALEPGEARTVTFHLPVNQVAFYDADLQLMLEPGAIEVMVGSSSADIRLRGQFEVAGKQKTAIDRLEYVCPVTVE